MLQITTPERNVKKSVEKQTHLRLKPFRLLGRTSVYLVQERTSLLGLDLEMYSEGCVLEVHEVLYFQQKKSLLKSAQLSYLKKSKFIEKIKKSFQRSASHVC